MQITQYETKKKNPDIISVVEFDQWPFDSKTISVAAGMAYIDSSGNRTTRTTSSYVLNTYDNCLVLFDDGTMAVSNQTNIALYRKNNGF